MTSNSLANDRARLVRCPSCGELLAEVERCAACGSSFPRRAGVVDLFPPAPRPEPHEAVTRFYELAPFPGYAPADDAASLLARSRRSPFLAELDRAVPTEARVLDCGCGTGQLAAFLALAGPRRRVVAFDACRASLEAAAGFQERARIPNLELYRADLFQPPFPEGAFDVVLSRGVVHHTSDPGGAIRIVSRRVAPGGFLVLGFYESIARAPHRLRRLVGGWRGRPFRALDPILRRRDVSDEKKRIWIEDQYRHPLEHVLAFPRVLERLEGDGFAWIRSVPPSAPRGQLFDATARPGWLGLALRRVGWALAGLTDPDAGLVSLIVRRHGGTHGAS